MDELIPDSESEKRLDMMRAMDLDVFKESLDWNWQDHFAKHPVIHLDLKVRTSSDKETDIG